VSMDWPAYEKHLLDMIERLRKEELAADMMDEGPVVITTQGR
jgi:hypothetical protein